jgi:hypothetical protein
MTSEERLLIHETVSTTADEILGAIQHELAKSAGAEGGNAKWREGFAAGLRLAESVAASASVTARSVAFEQQRSESRGDISERLHDARERALDGVVD